MAIGSLIYIVNSQPRSLSFWAYWCLTWYQSAYEDHDLNPLSPQFVFIIPLLTHGVHVCSGPHIRAGVSLIYVVDRMIS